MANTTHQYDELSEQLIETYVAAGMIPADEFEIAWVADRHHAATTAGDKLILASADLDDDRLTLTVTSTSGVIDEIVSFGVTEVGLAMFVAAAEAAQRHYNV